MSDIERIVSVTIDRQTTAVSRAGFGIVLIVGANPTFAERTRLYGTDLSALAADLTGGTAAPEYLAATSLMSQNPRPSSFMVGRIDIGDANIGATLDAIKNENNNWYPFLLADRTQTDQEDAADWSEANEKLFGVAADDTNIIDQAQGVDTTSIAAYIQDNNLDRSFALYSAEADGTATDSYPEAAMFGVFVWRDPGTYTVMFKTMAAIAADSLTANQITNALAKRCNIFHEVGGVDVIEEGTTGVSWIDELVGTDWLKARMTEDVFAVLVNLPKVPYTDSGIQTIGEAVEARLQNAVDVGFLAEDPAFTVSLPKAADVLPADKANRILNDVTFEGTLAGAIHKTVIQGVLSL